MPSKANREKSKAEKEERRRLGRERAEESRKRKRANPELYAVEFDPIPPRSALYLLTTNFLPLTVCTHSCTYRQRKKVSS